MFFKLEKKKDIRIHAVTAGREGDSRLAHGPLAVSLSLFYI